MMATKLGSTAEQIETMEMKSSSPDMGEPTISRGEDYDIGQFGYKPELEVRS